MNEWLLIDSPPGAPERNMAWDEALLESVARWNRPVVRFYRWERPAATFGYFQRYEEVASLTPLRPLLRRPTAGGLVPHEQDWTYSLAFPPGHFWYSLRAIQSYQLLHEWWREALKKLGVPANLAPRRLGEATGQCFVGAERFDLLSQRQKIAGAAQRRNRMGFLIQGSLQPPPPCLTREVWQRAVCDIARQRWQAKWINWEPEGEFEEIVERFVQLKYGQESYNRRR